MRVLYLSADPGIPVLGRKGASVHIRELGAALAATGAEVHIASPRVASEGEELSAEVGLHPIAPLPGGRQARPGTLLAAVAAQACELQELATALAVDAIYERYSVFGAAGVRAAAALGVPHALEVNAPLRRGAARYRTLPHPALAAELEAEALAGTGRILAVSSQLAYVLAGEGADASKLRVVPNGVDPTRFPSPRRHPQRFVAGFAGTLKPWHGIETLIEAIARVPQVHLHVVGHGPLEPLLERIPAARVTRLGALPHAEVAHVMSGWDVGLAPYEATEPFWFSPLKLLEYMAAGACAIASDLGDTPAILGDDTRGILIPAGDATALAEALAALASDRPRARMLGLRARAWVAVNRPWSANAQSVLQALGFASLPVAA